MRRRSCRSLSAGRTVDGDPFPLLPLSLVLFGRGNSGNEDTDMGVEDALSSSLKLDGVFIPLPLQFLVIEGDDDEMSVSFLKMNGHANDDDDDDDDDDEEDDDEEERDLQNDDDNEFKLSLSPL
mmetsp:Transcript_26926/g.32653  ORF Transcript_26926/g.32653 Transcript_26926/m.32653 type:complete len:124 (+) Transcript_26926:1953-2324(+)